MNLKGVLFFYDWSYFQDVVSLLNRAKKYCFHGIWMWVIFKAQTLYPNGGRRHTKHSESKCIRHLVLPTQSAKSQTTQAPSNITEKSVTGCCRTTSRVQERNRLRWECLPRSRLSLNSVWWVTCEMKALLWHFISWQSKILSQRTASTQHHLQHPVSSPQLCDVNANDISAMANM